MFQIENFEFKQKEKFISDLSLQQISKTSLIGIKIIQSQGQNKPFPSRTRKLSKMIAPNKPGLRRNFFHSIPSINLSRAALAFKIHDLSNTNQITTENTQRLSLTNDSSRQSIHGLISSRRRHAIAKATVSNSRPQMPVKTTQMVDPIVS